MINMYRELHSILSHSNKTSDPHFPKMITKESSKLKLSKKIQIAPADLQNLAKPYHLATESANINLTAFNE